MSPDLAQTGTFVRGVERPAIPLDRLPFLVPVRPVPPTPERAGKNTRVPVSGGKNQKMTCYTVTENGGSVATRRLVRG